MLGWLIVFALMAILNASLIFLGHSPEVSSRMAMSVFAFLFVLGLLTRAARSRAR
jgi:hypothetical protein